MQKDQELRDLSNVAICSAQEVHVPSTDRESLDKDGGEGVMRGYACIGLDNTKLLVNAGSALRAASVYNVALVAISGRRYRKMSSDTCKAYRHLPLLQVDDLKTVVPYDCIPVAVDLIEGAIPLPEFKHPERAFYVFGAEDATLGNRILSWCKDTVYVPTNGCMNLAATVNVVLYDRMAKQLREKD